MENKDIEIMDQTALAESVSDKVKFQMLKQFLVKPLDPIMVEKEFSTPVAKPETKDDNGIEASDYDEVTTEIKTVESDYRKAVVIKIPIEYERLMKDEKFPAPEIKVGDIIIYRARVQVYFDLLKDTQIVAPYDIIAIEK